jgi:hypothetical protein
VSLRWTAKQAREYLRGRGLPDALPPAPGPDPCDPYRGMNGLERDFAHLLESQGVTYRFNAVRLKLGEGAWFKPDFVTCEETGMRIFETKGFMREAANVRIKVAASLYPMWPFFLVKRVGGEWTFEEVKK